MGFLNNAGLSRVWGKVKALVSGKQDTLVSGTNIKTVNNQSLLGSGNISISGGISGGIKIIRKTITTILDGETYYLYLDIPTNYKLVPYLPIVLEGVSSPYSQAAIIINNEGALDYDSNDIYGFNFIVENGEQSESNIIVKVNNTYMCTYFVTNDDIADYDIEV